MAKEAIIYEKYFSPQGSWSDKHDDEEQEKGYIVANVADYDTAKSKLEAYAPAIIGQLGFRTFRLEMIGENLWDASVRYTHEVMEDPSKPATGTTVVNFDTTGGTQHITQSILTVNGVGDKDNGDPPPNFKGAIGVTHDSVEGVDITVPLFAFNLTVHIDKTKITTAYLGNLYRLTGRTNAAVFTVTVDGQTMTFQPGEVLFLGASGRSGVGDWEVSYKFAAQPNVTGLVIANLTPTDKKGWDYLWIRYQDAEDTAAKLLVKVPVAAYVERVYKDGDFSQLAF